MIKTAAIPGGVGGSRPRYPLEGCQLVVGGTSECLPRRSMDNWGVARQGDGQGRASYCGETAWAIRPVIDCQTEGGRHSYMFPVQWHGESRWFLGVHTRACLDSGQWVNPKFRYSFSPPLGSQHLHVSLRHEGEIVVWSRETGPYCACCGTPAIASHTFKTLCRDRACLSRQAACT